MKKTITLAMTGASGLPYAFRLLECLLKADVQVYLLISNAAQVVSAIEMELKLPGKIDSLAEFLRARYPQHAHNLKLFGHQQWTAPIASGSAVADAMVVCPCSSGCLSAIAQGASDNLIERAADVSLKERKPLILVTRETPLSAIHLQNMLTLAHAGAVILPASPGFYHQPKTINDLIDFVVARIMQHLDVEQHLVPKWGITPEKQPADTR